MPDIIEMLLRDEYITNLPGLLELYDILRHVLPDLLDLYGPQIVNGGG